MADMELTNGNTIARFIMGLFILLVLLSLSPLLYQGVVASKVGLNCGVDYTPICFIVDAALPILVIISLSMLIGYLRRH
jgi:hypothetical protein